jgi:myosin heavy subunit
MNPLHHLLASDNSDEQVLETDVMRFMAIIGIIFWIIFAMVKTLPFRQEVDDALERQTEPKQELQTQQMQQMQQFLQSLQKEILEVQEQLEDLKRQKNQANKELEKMRSEIQQSKQQQGELDREKNTLEADLLHIQQQIDIQQQRLGELEHQQEKTKKSFEKLKEKPIKPYSGKPTLSISFASMGDIKDLIRMGVVSIWIDTSSPSFQLVYQAEIKKGAITFTGKEKNDIPSSLWKIIGGKYFNAFVDILKKDHKVTRTFSARNVYIHFSDSHLEHQVEQLFTELKTQKRFGIIRINRDRQVQFIEYN